MRSQRNVDPAPDDETERFVADIYADQGKDPVPRKTNDYSDKKRRFQKFSNAMIVRRKRSVQRRCRRGYPDGPGPAS